MQYHQNQPFNENMLRPCPLLDNPDKLTAIVKTSGATSTDYTEPEDVEELCGKCVTTAEKWAQTANRLWSETHGCTSCSGCAAAQEETTVKVASVAR